MTRPVTESNGLPTSAAALDDPRVLRAAEEYAELLRAGRRPDRAAFLARYADIADALARCLGGRVEPIGDDFAGSSLTVPVGADEVPGLTEALAARGSDGVPEQAEVTA